MDKHKVWVISVDMGYGHQRAAYPFRDIAYERIITANSDKIVTDREKKLWRGFQSLYEGFSRMRSIPIIGEILWSLFDRVQAISPVYPFRDLSKPSFGAWYMHRLIKKGFLKSVVEYTRKEPLPILCTFFPPALAAANAKMKDVYCVITDSDISRAWAPINPKKDFLYYFAPTTQSKKRLMEYGVPEKNIFFTGFPLPKENTGANLEILKHDLGYRLPNLDPNKIHLSRYKDTIRKELNHNFRKQSNHPLTLTFVVGGAGAQKEIAGVILESLKKKINEHKIRVNLVAGTRLEIAQYFNSEIERLGLKKEFGKYVCVLCALDKKEHFRLFNEMLHTTDILWTKPSELSFYTALGIPLILSPPLGSHEILNQKWLMSLGTGIPQEDPRHVDEWLFEWLEDGRLAEAAWDAFMEAPKYGTYNIEKVLFAKNKSKISFRY